MELKTRKNLIEEKDNVQFSSERKQINNALEKEDKRKKRKEDKKDRIKMSNSYSAIKWIATVMDNYFIDPIVGFIPGFGDFATSILGLPYIYVSLFKIRSIPLTLAVIYNMLIDILVGIIPFFIGNILDFFNRSYRKNMRLIVGFVEDDREIIAEVNKKAIRAAISIAIFILLIYWLILFVEYIFGLIGDFFSWLF